jgi:hypothetical protein
VTNVPHAGVRPRAAAPPAASPRGQTARMAWPDLRRRTPHGQTPRARRRVSPAGTIARWTSAGPGCDGAIRREPCASTHDRLAAGAAGSRGPASRTGRDRRRRIDPSRSQGCHDGRPARYAGGDPAGTGVDSPDEPNRERGGHAGRRPEPPADHLVISGGIGGASGFGTRCRSRAWGRATLREAGASSREDCVGGVFRSGRGRKGPHRHRSHRMERWRASAT